MAIKSPTASLIDAIIAIGPAPLRKASGYRKIGRSFNIQANGLFKVVQFQASMWNTPDADKEDSVMARKKAEDTRKQRPPGKNRAAAFAREKIVVANAREVAEYLDAHADLAAIVPAICSRARQDFGKDAELMLRVYRDPEIDDHYLSLCVRLPSYDDTIIARLEGVTDPFDAELCAASGYFLITTDLQPPRAKKHAI